jgi:hypothetical protein
MTSRPRYGRARGKRRSVTLPQPRGARPRYAGSYGRKARPASDRAPQAACGKARPSARRFFRPWRRGASSPETAGRLVVAPGRNRGSRHARPMSWLFFGGRWGNAPGGPCSGRSIDVGYDLVDVVLMPASGRRSWRTSGATAFIAARTVSICELITSMVLLVAST